MHLSLVINNYFILLFDKDTPIEEATYINEEMKHVFAGIFKALSTFYNNKLSYSIIVERPDGSIQTTEEKLLNKSRHGIK